MDELFIFIEEVRQFFIITLYARVDEFAASYIGSIIIPLLPTAGILAALLGMAYLFLFSSIAVSDVFLIPIRFIGRVLSILGLKKRKRHWGTVYDSVTKQPLDPAFVELRNSVGKRVANVITDLDGRYGFVDQTPGVYTMTVKRTNYEFPSQMLYGREEDGRYHDLYYGEQMLLTKNQNSILKNIPLDPLGADWNELTKKEQHLLHSYTRHTVAMRFFVSWFFVFGLIITLAASWYVPVPYYYIICGLFIMVNFLRANHISSLPSGVVKEKSTGLPIPFAQVHIFYSTASSVPVKYATKICDQDGKYYCLAPKGRYYIVIDKKKADQSYTPVFTSEPFSVASGIINTTFEV
ncbi:MAG: carboxypeptidase-like regulatory domain-containing protein [bacterium]|nr:carboxypeptidase-like regulatory domain-containing protein [bacterium]